MSDALTELCDAGCRVTVERREGARKWRYLVYLAMCPRRSTNGGPYYGETVEGALAASRADLSEERGAE